MTQKTPEKQWHELIAQYVKVRGSVLGGGMKTEPIQYHHVAGRTYKQNKVLIGPWFVIPLPFSLHDVSSNDSLNVTHHRHAFSEAFGSQRDLWLDMIEWFKKRDIELPFGDDVITAVMDSKY